MGFVQIKQFSVAYFSDKIRIKNAKIMGPSAMEGPALYTIGFPTFNSVVSRGKGSH